MINDYKDGGLKLPQFFGPQNYSPWKILFLNDIQKWGGDKILYLSKEGLDILSKELNPLWRDVIKNFSKLKEKNINIMDNPNEVLSQSIWLNPNIKKGGKMVIKHIFCENEVFLAHLA